MAIVGDLIRCISPVDGAVLLERPLARPGEIDRALAEARTAWAGWRALPLVERVAGIEGFLAALEVPATRAAAAEALTSQMGRPSRWCRGEIDGFLDRARTMIALAPAALAPVAPPAIDGFTREIHLESLGTVLILAPWNYPWLTVVNTLVPALLAGNVVILKHSDQTPLVAEQMVAAARQAGLPTGVFQCLHLDHGQTAQVVADPRVDFVSFTGSVAGGHAVNRAAAGRFVGVGLELGGKDAAYVRRDADLAHAVPSLVEGALFNSGQSCCGVERIYVHEDRLAEVIERAVAAVGDWVVGDPRDPDTWLGPVVRASSAQAIRAQVDAALAAGARAHLPEATPLGPAYVAPQVLTGVDHTMTLMTEETFGPVVGIMPVKDDAEALHLMNDSCFGLTASIWTQDEEVATTLGRGLDVGTVFMNRCDYLDPHLAWVGVKNSGRGCTLSALGFQQLTRPKSYHLRTRT